ncbi:PilZ domain-containing protein [Microvirga sp. BT689]|uniref:PilZ domain-containing protein n=1 Tax=Microvirga arvi TaxID=2778731 RepID=UPI00194F6E1D|nr:PilZ domain-containing protein [Microvirga arvi]MBM6584311.1 PilZ domain-containing protein [Microvirga arvi]
MDERRSSKRWPTALKARVVFNNRRSVLDCTVRDLSETGARIYFADISAIPPEFDLEVPSRGIRVRAFRMWSRGANHGIMFLEQLKVRPDLAARTIAA